MEQSDTSEFLVPAPEDMLSPEAENSIMMWEQAVEPNINEDVMAHLESHYMAQSHPTYKTWTIDGQILLERHIAETLKLAEMMQGASGIGDELTQGGPEQQGALVREASGAGNQPGEDLGPDYRSQAGARGDPSEGF